MAPSTAALELVEALGLEAGRPEPRLFEDLFLRFQRRVGHETLTRPSGPARDFDPDQFFAQWLEEERGLAGVERVLAFAALARGLGFDVSEREGECLRPWGGRGRHLALVASMEGRPAPALADAAYPMPVLLPLDRSGEIPTGLGTLSIRSEGGDVSVLCDARAEVTEIVRLRGPSAPLPLADDAAEPTEPFEPFALRVHDDRVLHWSAGRMTVLDPWSRFEYPLPATERAALEGLFGMNLDGVELPAGEAINEPAVLTVYHASPVAPDTARERLAAAQPPPSLVARREITAEPADGGSRLAVRATLAQPVPLVGPGESVRKTLVFHLVSDLLSLGKE